MLKGSSNPKLIIGDNIFALPEPARGGRYEAEKDITRKRENVFYYLRRNRRQRFQFKAEYRFARFTEDNYRTLNRALNAAGQQCWLVPYSDKGTQKFFGYAHLEQINKQGYVNTKSIKLVFQQIGFSSNRMESDSLITGDLCLKGVV